jgi:hypothetical protein
MAHLASIMGPTGRRVDLVTRVKHRGMPSPWKKFRLLTERPPDRPLQDRSGAKPIGYARTFPLTDDQAEPEHALGLYSGLEGSLEPQTPDQR